MDTTLYNDVYDAPRQTNRHSTSWRSDVPPPCLGGASHGCVPVNTHGTPVLIQVRRPWVAQPRPRTRAGDTQTSGMKCEKKGCRPPSHGSGAELRTAAVNDRVQAYINSPHLQSFLWSSVNTALAMRSRRALDQEHHLLHECCERHGSARVLSAWVDRHARGEEH